MLRKIIIFLVLAIPFFGLAAMLAGPPTQKGYQDLPWDVKVLEDGRSEVFGVVLGETHLNALLERLRLFPGIALFEGANGDMRLEAYFGAVKLGPFEVNLIARLAMDDEGLSDVRTRAFNRKPMPSGAWRMELPDADVRRALELPMSEITYVPRARYDEATVRARFGEPSQVLPAGDERQYFLYPGIGLVILLASRGRDVLHYVAPAHFEALHRRILEGESLEMPLS